MERRTRVIEAQYILLNWPIWYIIAWDHLRNSSRVFRIDRIKKAKLMDDSFTLRPKEDFTGIYRPFYQTI
jgi:predicted DNA-binding transcriptional regulator YafY